MTTKIERLFIPGKVGRLEAILELNPSMHPSRAALVCHPHPQFGGTMHNKVVFRAAKAALSAGLPVLRFNFRGVGESGGTYAHGIGERDDVRVAMDYLQSRFPGVPLCLMGFSFGAWVGLTVGVADPRVEVLIALGLPVASYDMSFLRDVRKPKLFVQATLDEFGPADRMQALYDSLPEPKQIRWVQGVDHFFTGKLEEVQKGIREFLESTMKTT